MDAVTPVQIGVAALAAFGSAGGSFVLGRMNRPSQKAAEEQSIRNDLIGLIDKHYVLMEANNVLMLKNGELIVTISHRDDSILSLTARVANLEGKVPGLEGRIEVLMQEVFVLRQEKAAWAIERVKLGKEIETLHIISSAAGAGQAFAEGALREAHELASAPSIVVMNPPV